jgi:hypothetical protein
MVAFFSGLVFLIVIARMVLLSEPPRIVVGIVAVAVVGVLLRSFVPSSVWGRAWRRRKAGRFITLRR